MKRGSGKPYRDGDLDRLTPTERDVLRTYYDTDRTWEQVADALHYSVSRVYQLRRSAMDILLESEKQNKAKVKHHNI